MENDIPSQPSDSEPVTYMPIKLLYIIGPGHCGSTLLNLCLNMHPNILGVSEIVALNRRAPGMAGSSRVLSSPFWNAVAEEYYSTTGRSFEKIPFDFAGYIDNQTDLNDISIANYHALICTQIVSGKSILADSSKDIDRLRGLLSCKLFDVKVVYLVRDGRAVVHSYYRKYGNLRHGIMKIYRIDRQVRQLRAQFRGSEWCTVKYEDLALEMEKVLRNLCAIVNCDFHPSMLNPSTRDFKGIGGNRMKDRPISEVKLDEEWKREMTTLKKVITFIGTFVFNLRKGYLLSGKSGL